MLYRHCRCGSCMSRGQRASGFISRRGVHDPSCRVLLVGRIEVVFDVLGIITEVLLG
jgi:hypothetical protein